MDYAKILAYGAIGLGCILALTAAMLLGQELKQAKGKRGNFRPIYVFFAFSFALALVGFIAEYTTNRREIDRLEKALTKANNALESTSTESQTRTDSNRLELERLRREAQEASTALHNMRKAVQNLLRAKEGVVDQLRQAAAQREDVGYLVDQIRGTLQALDAGLQSTINDYGPSGAGPATAPVVPPG